jgi:hypothetical protein
MWAKTFLFFVFIFSIFFYLGCGGRQPNPIAAHQIGDESRSCNSLKLEITQNEALMFEKTHKDDSKFVTNTLWFVFFTPAMDLREAEKVEAEALRYRNMCLTILMNDKGCGATSASDPTGKSVQPTKTDQKVSVNKTLEDAPVENVGRFSSQKQTCSICGRTIPKLEQHFLVDEKITCKDCFAKLKQDNFALSASVR